MHNEYLKYTIKEFEYCIFLDSNTLACYFDELNKITFEKKNVIVDQLFFTGNKDNRFVLFEVINGKINFNSAKIANISKTLVSQINKVIFSKYHKLCKEYLSYYDYALMIK